MHIVRRLLKDKFRFASSAELFREYRLYVACEADEDIQYLAKCMGEDHLLIGSDYPTAIHLARISSSTAINVRSDISPELKQKLLYDNPRAFYGL
jgi:predicted TIM-barrel fold metal-dependent hydrolase